MQELILKLDDIVIDMLKKDIALREKNGLSKAFGDILLYRILNAYNQKSKVLSIKSSHNTPLVIRTFKENKNDNIIPTRT
jgi:hypothetical protein